MTAWNRSSRARAQRRRRPLYTGVTRYQWLVLIIASAGWSLTAFEGQLFNLTRQDLLRDLLSAGRRARQKILGDSSSPPPPRRYARRRRLRHARDRFGASRPMVAASFSYSVSPA